MCDSGHRVESRDQETCYRPITKNSLFSCNRNSKNCVYKFHFCNLGAIRTINYEFPKLVIWVRDKEWPYNDSDVL